MASTNNSDHGDGYDNQSERGQMQRQMEDARATFELRMLRFHAHRDLIAYQESDEKLPALPPSEDWNSASSESEINHPHSESRVQFTSPIVSQRYPAGHLEFRRHPQQRFIGPPPRPLLRNEPTPIRVPGKPQWQKYHAQVETDTESDDRDDRINSRVRSSRSKLPAWSRGRLNKL